MSIQEYIITKNDHTFFDELIVMLTSHVNFIAASYLIRNTDRPTILDKDGLSLIYESKNQDFLLNWKPYKVMKLIGINNWPQKVVVQIIKKDKIKMRETGEFNLNNEESKKLHQLTIQASFITYFERYKPKLKSNFGKRENWPDPWYFAWVIRNGYSHNGEVTFFTQQAKPASWNGITYGPNDNGKNLTGSEITIVDIFLLLLDLDTEIKPLLS